MRKITRENRRDEPTHFIPHVLISQSGRGSLAEQDYLPLPPLSQLQTLVVDLVRQFASGGKYHCTGSGAEIVLPS